MHSEQELCSSRERLSFGRSAVVCFICVTLKQSIHSYSHTGLQPTMLTLHTLSVQPPRAPTSDPLLYLRANLEEFITSWNAECHHKTSAVSILLTALFAAVCVADGRVKVHPQLRSCLLVCRRGGKAPTLSMGASAESHSSSEELTPRTFQMWRTQTSRKHGCSPAARLQTPPPEQALFTAAACVQRDELTPPPRSCGPLHHCWPACITDLVIFCHNVSVIS